MLQCRKLRLWCQGIRALAFGIGRMKGEGRIVFLGCVCKRERLIKYNQQSTKAINMQNEEYADMQTYHLLSAGGIQTQQPQLKIVQTLALPCSFYPND